MTIWANISAFEIVWVVVGALGLWWAVKWTLGRKEDRRFALNRRQFARAAAGDLLIAVGWGLAWALACFTSAGVIAMFNPPNDDAMTLMTMVLVALLIAGEGCIVLTLYRLTNKWDILVRLAEERQAGLRRDEAI